MPNQQLADRLNRAFSNLDLSERTFSAYTAEVAKAMIRSLAFEGQRDGVPTEPRFFYDNLQSDYCHILDFLQEMEAIYQQMKEEG